MSRIGSSESDASRWQSPSPIDQSATIAEGQPTRAVPLRGIDGVDLGSADLLSAYGWIAYGQLAVVVRSAARLRARTPTSLARGSPNHMQALF